MHLINASEVYYDFFRRAGKSKADELQQALEVNGIEIEDSLLDLWQQAGQIKAVWRRVSLADCFGIALTIREGGVLVTSDRHELERIAEAGICQVQFLR